MNVIIRDIFASRIQSWTLIMLCCFIVVAVLSGGCSLFKKDPAPFRPGGEWAEDMRRRIEETVTEPDRATALLDLVMRMEQELIALDREVQLINGEFFNVDSDYNATREDLQAVLDKINELRHEYRERLMNIRFAMRDLATPGEWERLTDVKKSKTLYIQWQRYPGE